MNPEPVRADLGPLESAADEVLVFDLAGRIVAANAAAARALGRSREELATCAAWDVLTRLSRVRFDWLVGALRTEGPQELLAHLCPADGSRHAVEARLWLAPLAGEERVYVLARSVRAHQTVIEEREQLVGLVETISETIAMATPDGSLSYLNPAGMRSIGIERAEDVAGLALHQLFAPHDRARIEEVVLPRVQREHWEGELTLCTTRAEFENRPAGSFGLFLSVEGYINFAGDFDALHTLSELGVVAHTFSHNMQNLLCTGCNDRAGEGGFTQLGKATLKELETRWEYARPEDWNGVREDMRIDRSLHSVFGAGKVAADVMVQEYGKYFGMRTTALRGGCLTGPNHSGVELHGFLSYLVRCQLTGRHYRIFGHKGKQVRDNIHSLDVSRTIEAIYRNPRPGGEVYNLNTGSQFENFEFVQAWDAPIPLPQTEWHRFDHVRVVDTHGAVPPT